MKKKREHIVPKNWPVPRKKLPDSVVEALENAKSENTKKSYLADWKIWFEWCRKHGYKALPSTPEAVAEFAAVSAMERKMRTVARRMTSISELHTMSGNESPTKTALVKKTIKGLKRKYGMAKNQAKALALEELRAICVVCQNDKDKLRGARDRALFLIGWGGALRQSELIGIDVEHLEFVIQGIEVTIPRSKSNQEGEEEIVRVPRGSVKVVNPVDALREWIALSGIHKGPVFRPIWKGGKLRNGRLSDRSVANILQSRCLEAGIENPKDFSGHSFRRGAATSLSDHGADWSDIMYHGRWKDPKTPLIYVERRDAWKAAGKLGL